MLVVGTTGKHARGVRRVARTAVRAAGRRPVGRHVLANRRGRRGRCSTRRVEPEPQEERGGAHGRIWIHQALQILSPIFELDVVQSFDVFFNDALQPNASGGRRR